MITHYGSAYHYYYYGRYDYDSDLNSKVVIKEATRSRVVIAKKTRDGVAVGDLVQVVDGFAYEKGGSRICYFPTRRRVLVGADGRIHAPIQEWPEGYEKCRHRLNPAQAEAVEAAEAGCIRLAA